MEILVALQGPTAYVQRVQNGVLDGPSGAAAPATGPAGLSEAQVRAAQVSAAQVSAERGPVQASAAVADGVTTGDHVGTADAERVQLSDLPARIAHIEAEHATDPVRWVWADTGQVAAVLLPAEARVRRCLDLRLGHAILRRTPPGQAWPDSRWDVTSHALHEPGVAPGEQTLLDDLDEDLREDATGAHAISLTELAAELDRQRAAIDANEAPAKIRLLLAAESVGALIAAEMRADGLPWDQATHDELLTTALGPRPPAGARPQRLEDLATQIRTHLDAPTLNPDSPTDVLRALRAQGLDVRTTRKGELARIDHAAISPLLEYKRLARLLSANGWAWLDEWVAPPPPAPTGTPQQRGRFRPDYVPGGVVTGRWATSGGGALQLPKAVRRAVRADPGWQLVVADAAQIEPRVLAAMSNDEDLAQAGRGGDLYQGLVDAGVVPSRDHAKVAVLGALYGGTSGDSGALMPRLRRTYPRAIEVVEQAGAAGERGGVVSTWLGRTSPPPPAGWTERQRRAAQPEAGQQAERRARQEMREWGRFTRNFVVQGTAAEWALCWLGEIRRRLRSLDARAHLVFYLHDEVIVHSPTDLAGQVAEVIRDAAQAAGALMFGRTAVDFPLRVSVVENYAEAA